MHIKNGKYKYKKPKFHLHNTLKEWQPTTFEYREENVSVRVPNIPAWVCPEDGETSFTPKIVDEIIATVRELLESAKRARKRRTVLTAYIVSIGEHAA